MKLSENMAKWLTEPMQDNEIEMADLYIQEMHPLN